MSLARILVLLRKEFLELRRNPGVFVPMLAMGLVLAVPFLIGVGVPRLLGEALSEDDEFRRAAIAATRIIPELSSLAPEAAAQAFLFHQFLLLFMSVPAVGAMALAAYSVIGEKQSRSLEPLLATPLTTTELLLAKLLGATIPALLVEALMLIVYLGGIAWLAEPGVAQTLVTWRTAVITGVLAPLVGLIALQLAVIVSSRVNDPRSAQQIGVVIVLPTVGVMIAQFAGVFWLTGSAMAVATLGLAVLWIALLAVGVRVFDREAILTRWR